MNTTKELVEIEAEIVEIQKKLMSLGAMHPGSTTQQYQACGKKGCKCQHPTEPQKHGPYCKLSYVHHGKKVCRFVRADCIERLAPRLQVYKEFRKLTNRWIALSIKRAQVEFFTKPDKHPQK